MTQVQRWTGVVSASGSGGFVAYGDYLALLDRLEKAEKDAERLDWLNSQGYAYGFQDMHEGNRWTIDGPFANVRIAIDRAMEASK